MNPELNDNTDKDLSKQLPPTPTTEARPEDVYTEPELFEPSTAQNQPIAPPAQQSVSPNPVIPPQDQGKGKTLAIIGIIFAILPFQLIGLVLSIIAKVKARKGTTANTLAIVGIVLNVVFGFIVAGIIIAITLTAYVGLTEETKKMQGEVSVRQESLNNDKVTLAKQAAITARKIAEAHNALEGFYPKTIVQLQSVTPIEIISSKALTMKPADPSIVEYAICSGGESFRIGYWNYLEDRIAYDTEDEDAGSMNTQDCVAVAQILNINDAEENNEPNRGSYPL